MAKKAADVKSKSTKMKTDKKKKAKDEGAITLVVCNIHIHTADGTSVESISKIAQSDVPDNMLALLTALRATSSDVS